MYEARFLDHTSIGANHKARRYSPFAGSVVLKYRWRAGGFFWRARGARALAARARMFVTSRVSFFPNQQYEI